MKIHYSEAEERNRWNSYATANSKFPDVRKAEIEGQLRYVSPQKGETILEVGTGNGILTFPLAKAVGPRGRIYSFDYRIENLHKAMERNTEALPITFVPQRHNPQLGYTFPLADNSIDTVCTTASFHHYDDRSLKTGTSGRTHAFQEFYRVLRKGGRLVICDIANNTNTQRYFDQEIDNPKSPAYCLPHGHPHDFLDEPLAIKLCSEARFTNIDFIAKPVPLAFKNKSEAGIFWKRVHNARCSSKESLECALKHLPFVGSEEVYILAWDLFYLTAQK